MCDYCGCRQQPLIKKFSEDHERLSSLGRKTLQALERRDFEQAERWFGELEEVLLVHLMLEETTLFEALQTDSLFDGTLKKLETDHAKAKVPVAGRPHDEGWGRVVLKSIQDLENHIFLEEHDVFPAAVQVVQPHVWEQTEAKAHDFYHQHQITH